MNETRDWKQCPACKKAAAVKWGIVGKVAGVAESVRELAGDGSMVEVGDRVEMLETQEGPRALSVQYACGAAYDWFGFGPTETPYPRDRVRICPDAERGPDQTIGLP